MNSSKLALAEKRKRNFRLTQSLVVLVLAAGLSAGCKATCRDGQYLREGLCHSPPVEQLMDAGGVETTPGDGGPDTQATGTRNQAASATEAGVSVNASMEQPKDAGAPQSKHDSGMSAATKGSAKEATVCGNGVREGTELCDGEDCKTAADCASDNACVVSKLEGAAKTCDAECTTTKIDTCKSGDGCCPDGCDHGTDDDCSPSCGDGVLTGTETCEPGSSANPCPTAADCDDVDPCTDDMVTGNARQCSAKCAHAPLTRKRIDCDDGDPCTDDESVESTTACKYECKQSPPHKPTGSCVDSDPCTDDTPMMSKTACKYECPHAPVKAGTPCGNGMMCNASGHCEAPPARCGDGMVNGTEECDPMVPGWAGACGDDCKRRLYTLCPCSDGAVCVSGMCTFACQRNEDCSRLPDRKAPTCVPVHRSETASCIIECSQDTDCPKGLACRTIIDVVRGTAPLMWTFCASPDAT